MRLCLDTNRYSDLRRGDAAVAQVISSAQEVYLPFIVLAELQTGLLLGSRRQENERRLTEFLSQPGARALYPNDETVKLYAALIVQLRRQGTPLPNSDVWIGIGTSSDSLRERQALRLHSGADQIMRFRSSLEISELSYTIRPRQALRSSAADHANLI